jgi:hypothetical protein
MRHFGTPLVPTVFDFGLNGKPPLHAALLDWLAVELMEREWSMKAIHRRIVTSQAYRRQSSGVRADEPSAAIDPENRYLWRMNARRMEAEAVRDNVLHAAGNLDPALGGPDLDPADGQKSRRRSLYFRHAKEKRMPFLKLFDSANATSCYRRTESVVPQQALALANSPLVRAQAGALAGKLSAELGEGPGPEAGHAFVSRAFLRILGRPPTSDELALCTRYLSEQETRLTSTARPAERAREDLVHVLFNHNDFVTIR